ncbi:hypothetical protein [Bradyrhizobium cytisi]|uniref:hypothetical protein n=1 Tax=Bradyrhizobium cytisi TaxID=515489 RepID=UPI003D314EE6
MARNIYDNPDFFAGYSQSPRQLHGLDGAPEWPEIKTTLPDLVGMHVVDLGCGFGWASRWMREQGAASDLGLTCRNDRGGTRREAVHYAKRNPAIRHLTRFRAFACAFSSCSRPYDAKNLRCKCCNLKLQRSSTKARTAFIE